MATIQLRRQLKYSHPKAEAIKYIKKNVTLAAGEPLLCTYKESNGKWGSIEVICLFPKETTIKGVYPNIPDNLFDENDKLTENILKINDDIPEWDKI